MYLSVFYLVAKKFLITRIREVVKVWINSFCENIVSSGWQRRIPTIKAYYFLIESSGAFSSLYAPEEPATWSGSTGREWRGSNAIRDPYLGARTAIWRSSLKSILTVDPFWESPCVPLVRTCRDRSRHAARAALGRWASASCNFCRYLHVCLPFFILPPSSNTFHIN